MKSDEVLIRALAAGDLPLLDAFRCSTGTPWEDAVEAQIRGPLPQRYLASLPRFDGRMLIGAGGDGNVLVIGAQQMIALGRHPRTFVRVDRRNRRSLALCDRIGLTDERSDPHSDLLVQRWGELPQIA